jgi:phosphate transport system substrate-binding protein
MISKTSFPPEFKPARKWTIPIALALLAAQGLAIFWVYKMPKTNLSKAKSEACVVSDRTGQQQQDYLQVCNAMQDILNVPNGQFFYGGTMGAAALRSQSFLNEIKVAHPDFRLRYHDPLSTPPDSTTGIKMLMDGELSFAESQRPIRDQEYQQAKDRGFTLKQIPVAMTGAAFYTHRDLRLPGLSVSQLQAIYLGKITNWAEVGGPNLPIIPVSQDRDQTGSTLSLLIGDLSLQNQPLTSQILPVRDTTAALRTVATTPGAIGFGTQAIVAKQQTVRLLGVSKAGTNYIQSVGATGEINKGALQDGTYPLTQRIFVVIRQDETLDEMAGFAYANLLLSEKGQALIDGAGYLPIRSEAKK